MMAQKFQFALVDPIQFTNYNRTVPQLEAMLLFSVLVAGKAALPTARALDRFLNLALTKYISKSKYPFKVLNKPYFTRDRLAAMLRACGVGCYNQKCITVHQIVRSGLNLQTCTVDQLTAIHGIGPKTARMFLLHSRPNQRYAALDVHILHYLRDLGHDVPRNTPGSARRYAEIEQLCLRFADDLNMSPADWDLMVWNHYRRRNAQRGTTEERTEG